MSVAEVRRLAREHYLKRQRLARLAASAARSLWMQLDQGDVGRSWPPIGRRLFTVVAAAQLEAAGSADGYVGGVLAAQGATAGPAGPVAAESLAGVASDGRPLESLLFVPVVDTLTHIADGMTSHTAFQAGLRQLTMIAGTQVQDAGRVADGVATVAHRQAAGYMRVLTPPSCSRCAILAGRWYRWNAGFDRHPSCDCVSAPGVKPLEDLRLNPQDYFKSLSAADQDRTFTKAGAQAIRDGADIAQVVNARRGMAAAGALTTSEGMTRRGFAGRPTGPLAGRGARRLTPEGVYAIASSREQVIELLRRHGYLS